MATQGNAQVLSALVALDIYQRILVKMLNEETEYRNQFSLQYLMALNERMIAILKQFEYSKTGLTTLPQFLQVDVDNVGKFYQNLNDKLTNDRDLVRLTKSQNIRWENLVYSLLELPFDFIREFANGLDFSLTFLCESTVILYLILIPELIAPAIVIVAALSGAYGIGRALFGFYDKMTPTYEKEGFQSISSAQQSAIEDLIEFNKSSFSTFVKPKEEDDFAVVTVQGKKENNNLSARQGFFMKSKQSDQSLADQAASKYELVSSCMQM